MERKLNIKVLLPEEVIEKYDIDEDTGVLSYSKQGLCVPQKSQSQPKSADSLGAQPPIPQGKERCV